MWDKIAGRSYAAYASIMKLLSRDIVLNYTYRRDPITALQTASNADD